MSARRWRWPVATLLVALAGVSPAAEGRAEAQAAPAGAMDPPEAKQLAAEAKRLSAEGRYAEARKDLERTLAIRERALGAEGWDVALTLNDLATVAVHEGDYVHAGPLLERALAIDEHNGARADAATVLHNLATLHYLEGDYARAEQENRRALAIREAIYGDDHPFVALSLDNLAVIYVKRGEYARAEPLLLRATAIREKALGPDHPDVAAALQDLATMYLQEGDDARAEPLFERAIAIHEKAAGGDRPELARTLNNFAELYLLRGDHARARPLFERALAIREATLGPDHPDVALSLESLASLYVAAGRVEEAVPLEARAVDVVARQIGLVIATGTEAQKLAYADSYAVHVDRAVSLHAWSAPASRAALRLGLTTALRHKGLVLDAMADELAALRRRLTAGDRVLLDRLASVEADLGALINRGPGKLSPADHRRAIAAQEAERQKLEAELAGRSAAFRAERRPVTIDGVQAAIPGDTALLELVQYRPYDPGASKAPARLGAHPPRYAAYVLRSTGEPSFADLGDAAPVDRAARVLRAALSGDALGRDPAPAARDAYARIMAPVRALLGDARRVFVSPDAGLDLVPFAALMDGTGRYLIERYTFTYLTSGRDLVRRVERPPPRQGPLVLAAPDYGAASSGPPPPSGRRGRRATSLEGHLPVAPLPGTIAEAQAIAAQLPGARVLLGALATEGAVKAARAPSILHLATHGFFFEQRRGVENPLLRAGLLLAGANALDGGGGDDGILTALEASELDLDGTRLVVLSACDTGLGEASRGEGVYGLRRALSIAGAETIAMSLWDADDDATLALMTAYYERLAKGEGRGEAMRQAQLALLARPATAHPSLWAAFIVSGDDGPMPFGEARVPKAAPSARGCACTLPDGGRDGGARAAAAILLVACARARRRIAPATRGRSTR